MAMTKRPFFFRLSLRPMLAGVFLLLGAPAWAQFLPEEIGQRTDWEEYLKTARIVGSLQITGPEAVTKPWKLTLSDGAMGRFGLWKNPEGRLRGYLESWQTEIAAYRMDKLLELHMVPPTVERRFDGTLGSIQLCIESEMSLKKFLLGGLARPPSATP